MHYGVDLGDMQSLWKNALHEMDGSCCLRSRDDSVEKIFWKQYLLNKKDYHPDEYSIPLALEIKNILEVQKPDTILELGPGWGNYTFTLASLCKELTCVDISPDILQYITKIAMQKEIYNIKTISSKWEDAILSQKYSAIFAYNCFYRMINIRECLQKIHDAAEFHVIGMTSGPDQPYLKDFKEELGLSIKWHRFDYIYLINILYQLDIDVNCKIVPLKKTYTYDSIEELSKKESGRILDRQYDQSKVLEILKRYYKPIGGKYQFEHHFCGAILFW